MPEFVKDVEGEWVVNPAFMAPEAGRTDEFGEWEFELNLATGEWEPNENFDPESIVVDIDAGKQDEEGNFEFIWDYVLGKWVDNPDYTEPSGDEPNPPTPPDDDEFDENDPDSKNVPDGYVWCTGPQKWILQPEIPEDVEDAEGHPKYVWDGSLDVPAWVENELYVEKQEPDPQPEPSDEFDENDPDSKNVPEGYVWCEGPSKWIEQPPEPEDNTTDPEGYEKYFWNGDIETPAWELNPLFFDITDPNADDAPTGYVWCEGPQLWMKQTEAPEDQNEDDEGNFKYIWDGNLDEPAWVENPEYNDDTVDPEPEPNPDTPEFDETDPNAEAPEGYVWCDGPSKWVLQPEIPEEVEDSEGHSKYVWDGDLEEPAWVINTEYIDDYEFPED